MMQGNSEAKASSTSIVVNPYAKKRSASLQSSSNSSSIMVDFDRNVQQKKKNKTTTNHENYRTTPLHAAHSLSFSQAFGDYHPEALYGEEDRADQLDFDLSLKGQSAIPDDSLGKTTSIDAARDHHPFLQPHVLHVSTRQRGNPILAHIRNVPFQFSKMVPDYLFAPTRCGLFLSIRYHNLHPNYIHRRIAELKSDFDLRVLLCHVDIVDNASVLLFLNDVCVQNNMTLILAWSEEEAARYLETFKAFDGKDASSIQKREHTNHIDQVSDVLGSVRAVNKTDSSQLLTQFGTWRNLAGASMEELSVCPGVGVKKVRRLFEAFRRPFSKGAVKRRKRKDNEEKTEGSDIMIDENHDDQMECSKVDDSTVRKSSEDNNTKMS